MSGSPISPEFPTVALQRSKSSASVHGGGALRHLEVAPSLYLSIYLYLLFTSSLFSVFQAQLIAQSIGQAFQVAYMEFLKANGIDDPGLMKEMDYQEVLNQQEIYGEELYLFANKDMQKEVGLLHTMFVLFVPVFFLNG